jgi:propanediol dehydratase large subunit
MDIAKGQAGLPPENDFHIIHFDYGVKIVANLLEKFLEGTNFMGVSVSIACYYDNDYPNPSTDNL